MSNSKERLGGQNFSPKQLTEEWKPKEERTIVVPKPTVSREKYKVEEK
jgi:hypothetical protein